MKHWSLPLLAALVALLHGSKPAPVRACLYPAPELIVVGMSSDSVTQLGSGADILIYEICSDVGCKTTAGTYTIRLRDGSGAEVPFSVEPLSLTYREYWSRFLRVHPQTPLQPGRYSLHTLRAPSPTQEMANERSYAFTVAGTALETSSAKFTLSTAAGTYATGKEYPCAPVSTSCGPYTPILTTKLAHRVLISAHPSQVPESENGQFVYRLVVADAGADPDPGKYWFPGSFYVPEALLAAEFREQRPEYCVELQAIRVRDVKVQSLGKQCVKYTLPSELYPEGFVPCQVDPTEYARAYCTENALACSEKHPRAKEEIFAENCKLYGLMCAPFLGNRTPRDRPGCERP